MSWLESVMPRAPEQRSTAAERGARWWGWDFSDMASSSGVSVNSPEKALAFSAFWNGVNIISGSVGCLPLNVYRRTADGKAQAKEQTAHHLLHDRPNPFMSALAFRQTLTAHALIRGNGYAEIEWDGAGRVRYLWPLPPQYVVPLIANGEVFYSIEGPELPKRVLRSDSVLHIHGLGDNGYWGYSVLSLVKESLGLGLAAEKFGAKFFGNGATTGGVLTFPGKLGAEATKNLRESVERVHQGLDKAHRLMVVEEGGTFAKTMIPPDEAQFLETRHFQVEEVARWLDLPAYMLKEANKPTYASVELQGIEFVTRCLMQWLRRWELECTYKLFGKTDLFCEFNADALLRGDTKSRYEAYTLAISAGWMKRSEVRERENLNPAPELDTLPIPGAAAPPDPKDEEPEGEPEPKADGKDSARFLPLFTDLARRMTTREVVTLRRDKKQPDEFWRCHRDVLTDALSATLVAMGGKPELAGVIAAEHCASRRAALAATNGNLSDVLDSWERTPGELALAWMTRAMA